MGAFCRYYFWATNSARDYGMQLRNMIINIQYPYDGRYGRRSTGADGIYPSNAILSTYNFSNISYCVFR
jgi:hypothetical protein